MDELQIQLETVLSELKEQIIQFFEQDMLDVANTLMEQYIKLAPKTVERYSLEAMIYTGTEDLDGAEKILLEGISENPLSFDLLYNLGYVYEVKENYLEAYNMYMKARYIAEKDVEKQDIGEALTRLVPVIKGNVVAKDREVSTIITAGETALRLTSDLDVLIERKKLLECIEQNIHQDAKSVLEIGFQDGIISKNLNYYGYEVTAVDRVKERIINVIAREWHDNMLQPDQKVAKFYYEDVDLDWLGKIPKFDVIIAVSNQNLEAMDGESSLEQDLLRATLAKTSEQAFILVTDEEDPMDKNFTKKALLEVVNELGLEATTIHQYEKDGINYELCLVNLKQDLIPFRILIGGEARHSRSTILEVDLAKCTDLFGAAYINDFQQFVAMLKEYGEDPELKYEDSVLKEYYDKFKPRNQEETLFAKRGRARKLDRGWIGYPWSWYPERRVVFMPERGETRPGGNHNFGPNSFEFGSAEFGRLIHLYDLLKMQGYHPELFADGYVTGYLLVKGDDYRFVVTEGQHRVACLAALGYERIKVRFSQKPEYPRVVVFEDVKKWAQVANGSYSQNLALRVFERFFAEGVGKDRMGLK